ncbi:hypothetical protein SporoP37_12320 [Sporosarcina sp. P37]|uniref:S8 family peptidase n=1 Tax=unclassified Sporosarcina TaxID=2647733 RepID=UPI000A17F337|nr:MULTISPECIES: S8 family peptidase [unclassified Sporosarcina]ARK25362.1 hypothetical protein SporoP37_12320 [Sporosarcina sp. P37]
MKKLVASLIAALLVAFAGFTINAQAQSVEGKYIVYYENHASINPDRIMELGGEVLHAYKHLPALLVQLSDPQLNKIKFDESVKHVEADEEIRRYTPIQSLDGRLSQGINQTIPWGVRKVRAQSSWRNYTGKGVKVAVLDSGISLRHEDVTVSGGVSFVAGTSSYADDHNHGTHVAGIIGAKNNHTGVVGVAPDAELYAVKVIDRNNSFLTSDLIKGIDWSITNEMDILNMSLYTYDYYNHYGLHEIIKTAYNEGMLLVGITGNTGTDSRDNTVNYPGKYSEVIAVGSIDEDSLVSYYSSFGSETEVTAPGSYVYSTLKNGSYGYMSGTSMAAPHVAGLLALLKEEYPNYTNRQLRSKLIQNSIDMGTLGRDPYYGHGLVQANVAEAHYKTWPAKKNIPQDKVWKIKFNHAVDTASVNDATVYITSGYGYRMPTVANLAKDENGKNTIVEVWTYDLFELGGTYTLWIEDLRNADGKYLKENVKMEFTISDM